MMFTLRSVFIRAALSNKLSMSSHARAASWIANGVDGFLLDVYGVLYDSGSSDIPIPGSVEAIKR